MRFLLDTNVLSEVRRPAPNARVLSWLDAADEDRLFMSVISIAEIRRGVGLLPTGRRREALAQWLAEDLPQRFAGRLLLVEQAICQRWGDLMARATTEGRPLQPMDAFFAATAGTHDLTLVTRNVRDFADTGVPLVNPWEA